MISNPRFFKLISTVSSLPGHSLKREVKKVQDRSQHEIATHLVWVLDLNIASRKFGGIDSHCHDGTSYSVT